MRETTFRYLMIFWCGFLTIWGGYFTYAFVVHERWADEQSEQILHELRDIKRMMKHE